MISRQNPYLLPLSKVNLACDESNHGCAARAGPGHKPKPGERNHRTLLERLSIYGYGALPQAKRRLHLREKLLIGTGVIA
jgi:hypothetical protein